MTNLIAQTLPATILALLISNTCHAYSGTVDNDLNGSVDVISGYHYLGASTCDICHTDAFYSAAGGLTWSFSNNVNVAHGSTATYSVRASSSPAVRNGFNLAAYAPPYTFNTDRLLGSFSSPGTGVQLYNDEVAHTAPQAANFNWSFGWTAPDTLGSYRFYVCINQVNNDGKAYRILAPLDPTADGAPICGNRTLNVINNAPNAVNDSPATSATLDVSESGSFTNFNVCNNDTDTENDAISYVSSTALAGLTGTLTHGTGCNFSYNTNSTLEALDTGETDTGTFTYTIQDTYGSSYQDTATVTIRVNGANDAPIAVADSITVNEGGTATTLDSTASSALTNDSDVDIEPLTAALVTNVSNGSLTLNSDGTFSYTHNGSETTTDSFTYRAYDGIAYSNTVTVSINITPQNDRPVANNDSGNANEGAAVTIDLLGNDTDSESSPLTIVSLSSATNGTVSDNGDGTVTYTHNGGESTSDSFTYYAYDGVFASLAPATVSVTVTPVNDPPVITSSAVSTATESSAYIYTLTVTDPDDTNNGSNLVYSLSGEPAGMSVSTTGVVTWTPPQTNIFNSVVGPITIQVADGGEDGAIPDTQTFSITVNPPDADSDVIADYNDNCVNVANNDQADIDSDNIGDVCDGDPDGNGLLDTYLEYAVTQGSRTGSIIFQDTNVRVTANLAVAGSGSETYDWSATDSAILAAQTSLSGNILDFNPASLALGVYNIDVTVTDDGSTTHNTLLLNLLAASSPPLTSTDTDGDGLADDDGAEGYADDDNDGVPNLFDDTADTTLLPTQSADFNTLRYLQSDAGTKLSLGTTATAAGHFGAIINTDDLTTFGGTNGTGTTLNTNAGYTAISEYFDFIITGMTVGGTTRVVLPLSTNIQYGAIYRKFTPTAGWNDFVVDSSNTISSAISTGGICPAPGSSDYLPGLIIYNNCVQLTLVDGGPNDADGEQNGVIRDPGVVVVPTVTTSNSVNTCTATLFNNCPEQGGSIGFIKLWYLFIMLSVLAAIRLRRQHI